MANANCRRRAAVLTFLQTILMGMGSTAIEEWSGGFVGMGYGMCVVGTVELKRRRPQKAQRRVVSNQGINTEYDGVSIRDYFSDCWCVELVQRVVFEEVCWLR